MSTSTKKDTVSEFDQLKLRIHQKLIGKLDLARRNFIFSIRDKSLTEKEKEDAENLLEVIEKLKK